MTTKQAEIGEWAKTQTPHDHHGPVNQLLDVVAFTRAMRGALALV